MCFCFLGIKPFECDICHGSFSSNVALTEHKSRHFDEKPYRCKHCGKEMRHVSSFKRHMMTHSNDLPFTCTVCHRQFSQAPYLRSHMKIHTGGYNTHILKTSICISINFNSRYKGIHKVTKFKGYFYLYMSGEKPFHCPLCPKRFAHQSDVKRHRTTHTGMS